MQSVQRLVHEGQDFEAITGDGATNEAMHFTVFIRLPMPRGDFVDPPLVSMRDLVPASSWRILRDDY